MVIIRAKKNHRIQADNTFYLNDFLFVFLIGLLILWAFQGSHIKKLYEESVIGSTQLFGAKILSSANGIEVQSVIKNTAADFAGLKKHDIIIGLDNHLISSLSTVLNIIDNAASQESALIIHVVRNDRQKDIYVNFNTRSQTMTAKSKIISFPSQLIVIALFVKLTAVMFLLMIKNIMDRMYIVLVFSFLILAVGKFFNIYSLMDAFFSIKFDTISLLLGMGIISIVLDESGVFNFIAFKMFNLTRGDRLKILVIFCFVTYIFSLLVNNLTTILVIVPMTLKMSTIDGFDPKPVVIAEIIASNLGGASTIVGDFPNMLISSEMNIPFNEFLFNMMPVCMILFSILLVYCKITFTDFFNHASDPGCKPRNQKINRPVFTLTESRAIKRAVLVLFHIILLFMLSSRLTLNPSAIALTGGLSLYLFSGIDRKSIINRIGFNDIVFFIGLFIVVGGIEASGLIHYISKSITFLSLGKTWLLCLIIMWAAAFITSFLNAGPTTAIFFPIILNIALHPPANVIWWSLSLGVLAGSSATIIGATAGPVSAGLVEKHCSLSNIQLKGGNTIQYIEFSNIGLPIMFIFLFISSIYICYLNIYYG